MISKKSQKKAKKKLKKAIKKWQKDIKNSHPLRGIINSLREQLSSQESRIRELEARHDFEKDGLQTNFTPVSVPEYLTTNGMPVDPRALEEALIAAPIPHQGRSTSRYESW